MNQNINKTVIITGGCGYIGSHIAKVLSLSGQYNIVIIDRQANPHAIKYANLFVKDDIDSDQSTLLLNHIKPDAIVHCAGDLIVGESVSDPGLYYTNNVAKSANFLNQVRQLNKLPVVVFSSSASVYGIPKQIPVKESANKNPINPYGRTKLIIEQLLADFDYAYGLKSISLRYFNACGAEPFNFDLGQASGASHIIAKLLESKLNNRSFILNGTDFLTNDGTCVRDYIHVWDLAIAHLQAIEFLLSTQQSQILNLGTNTGISNLEIINYVEKYIGEIDLKFGPRRDGDPDSLIADATLAKNLLDWSPNYSDLETIVTSAWKWYNSK